MSINPSRMDGPRGKNRLIVYIQRLLMSIYIQYMFITYIDRLYVSITLYFFHVNEVFVWCGECVVWWIRFCHRRTHVRAQTHRGTFGGLRLGRYPSSPGSAVHSHQSYSGSESSPASHVCLSLSLFVWLAGFPKGAVIRSLSLTL